MKEESKKRAPRKVGGRNNGRGRDTKRNAVKPAAKRAAPAAPSGPPAPAPVLSGAQRKHLRGLSHHLEPVVQVGHQGVTASVVTAAQSALRDHELIKVRLHEPEDKKAMAAQLAEATASALCGLVGHTVILFRPNPQQPRISL